MKVSGHFHAPAALPSEKPPPPQPYPLGRRLGVSQSRSGHGGEEENITSFTPPGIEPPSSNP
jgi:hypothetical protein